MGSLYTQYQNQGYRTDCQKNDQLRL